MNPMLNIAIQAIRQAGSFIIKQYETFNNMNNTTIQHKNNLLIKINKQTNNIIKNIIKKYYPTHTIILQKNCDHHITNDKTQWIINPLDSATNFVKHFPYFSLSIAIKIKGCTEISVIYDPIHNDLFSAVRGKGTKLNGYRIHHTYITKKILYEESIITCFPYFEQNIIIKALNNIHQKKLTNFRYSGSMTLDLAYIAAGRIDALFATNIKAYKLESASLLITEAGGLILKINNNMNKNSIYKNIIAGHPKFIKFIIEKNLKIKNILK